VRGEIEEENEEDVMPLPDNISESKNQDEDGNSFKEWMDANEQEEIENIHKLPKLNQQNKSYGYQTVS